MNINDIRKDLEIMVDGQPHVVTDVEHVKPSKGPSFARVKLKNLDTGAKIERTYTPSNPPELADVEHRQLQYSYPDGTDFVFMDAGTGDQITVPGEKIGEPAQWLTEGLNVDVTMFKGRPIDVKIPSHVVIQVVGIKLGGKDGATKPVILSTGAVVNVPLFVQEGEWVKVDTSGDGIYVERVNR